MLNLFVTKAQEWGEGASASGRPKATHHSVALASLFGLATCYAGNQTQALGTVNPNDTGPRIAWELDATPLPNIPFPNDIGTRPDLDSPTGRRVNVSRQAVTRHETLLRTLTNTLDGFGTYAPIWLPLDGPIDIVDFFARQTDSDPSNDAVYVINIDKSAPAFGEVVQLDVGGGPPNFGNGRFPLLIENPDQYFESDPRAAATNLLLETVDEDLNGDGVLDAAEDTDDDGRLDVANTWASVTGDSRYSDPNTHLLTAYELETNTLLLRPLQPLAQQSAYAVVVTRALKGLETQSPVRSPFAHVHHLQQTRALAPLVDDGLLGNVGLTLDDVAFAWSFTTQTITKDLEAIRAGLYGGGPLAFLAATFPAELEAIPAIDDPGATSNVYTLTAERLDNALNNASVLQVLNIPANQADALGAAYLEYVDYFIFAEIDAPRFVSDDTGALQVDLTAGTATFTHDTLYLNCAVPKSHSGYTAPFRVAMYNHGSGSTRLEILGFAASLARFGFATCGIDAWGHGLLDNDGIRALAASILAADNLEPLGDMVFKGRSRDLNNDGFKDSGGDFWTANMFHTRDVVRQTIADYFQVIRVLRGFGTTTMPVDVNNDGALEIAGDFNGDGIVDFGGEQPYAMMGQSLGGIMTAVLTALEPAFTATAPVVAGAGLTDIAARSMQPGMVEAVFLPVFGTLVVGRTLSSGAFEMVLNWADVLRERTDRFAFVPHTSAGKTDTILQGDRIVLRNRSNGEADAVSVRGDTFRLRVATDVGDTLEVELYRDGAATPYRRISTWEVISADIEAGGLRGETVDVGSPLFAPQDGFGMRRGSPALRRLLGFAQMIVDAADPANYAPYYLSPLPITPDGPRTAQALVVASAGDMNVPVSTGVALGRIAGLIGQDVDPRYGVSHDQLLLDNYVIEGLEKLGRFATSACQYDARPVLFDIDEPSQGSDVEQGPHLSLATTHPDCVADNPPAFCTPCAGLPPPRATLATDVGTSGFRVLYQDNNGSHSFKLPDSSRDFDSAQYQINQIGWFFRYGEILDDLCLATADAPTACQSD